LVLLYHLHINSNSILL